MEVAVMLDAFVEDLRLRRQAESTIAASRIRIRQYLEWCTARDLDPKAAGHDDFLAYLRHLQEAGHKTTTMQREFVTLLSFYEFLDLASAGELKKIRKKYLRAYKPDGEKRQIISVQQASEMVAATCSTRDQAILQVLFKTGIRRGEITTIDVSDVDMEGMSIQLKPTGKRSNRLVFFDREAQAALRRWLVVRQSISPALFTTSTGERLGGWGLSDLVIQAAERVCLHDSDGPLEKRFGPHCCRHWFTTHLLRAGMRREYVQFLRGDAIKEAVDIYYHIDPEDVRRAYLACIPRLGV